MSIELQVLARSVVLGLAQIVVAAIDVIGQRGLGCRSAGRGIETARQDRRVIRSRQLAIS